MHLFLAHFIQMKTNWWFSLKRFIRQIFFCFRDILFLFIQMIHGFIDGVSTTKTKLNTIVKTIWVFVDLRVLSLLIDRCDQRPHIFGMEDMVSFCENIVFIKHFRSFMVSLWPMHLTNCLHSFHDVFAFSIHTSQIESSLSAAFTWAHCLPCLPCLPYTIIQSICIATQWFSSDLFWLSKCSIWYYNNVYDLTNAWQLICGTDHQVHWEFQRNVSTIKINLTVVSFFRDVFFRSFWTLYSNILLWKVSQICWQRLNLSGRKSPRGRITTDRMNNGNTIYSVGLSIAVQFLRKSLFGIS